MDKQIDAETDKATALWEIRQLDTLYRLLSRGVQAAKSFPKFLETIRSIEENENIAPLVFPNSRLPKGPKAKKIVTKSTRSINRKRTSSLPLPSSNWPTDFHPFIPF